MNPHGVLRRAQARWRRSPASASANDRPLSGEAGGSPELDIVAAFEPPAGLVERIEPLILHSLRARRAEATRPRRFQGWARGIGTSSRGRSHGPTFGFPAVGRTARAGASVLGILILSGGLGQAAYATSGAGQPLYGIRVSIERAMLPGVDADGRVSAQLVLLERRLDEAEDAANRTDTGALAAAMATYRSDLADLRLALGRRPDQFGSAVVGLRTQLGRLRLLVDRAGSQARPEVWESIREIRDVLRVADPAPPGERNQDGGPATWRLGGEPDVKRVGRTAHWTGAVLGW